MEIPKEGNKRVVIVGAGFAGVQLARKLARKDIQVLLLDRNNHHTFQPLLYQVATAALEPGSIAYPVRKIFNHYKNIFFRMGEVHKVIPVENKILFEDDEIYYDFLVIATGAKTNFFGNEGLTVNSMSMKNVVEAIDLRNMILQNFEESLTTNNPERQKALRTIVIAGAGPTGVELAGSLGELKTKVFKHDYPEIPQEDIKVILIEGGDRVLSAMHPKSSAKAKKYLEKLGVTLHFQTMVQDYRNDCIKLNKGPEISAHTLIWTAGVTGDPIEGLKKEWITRGNRILVDEINKVIGSENIFAIGDIACMISEKYPNGHPQMAQPAMQQGWRLGKNLIEMIRNGKPKPFVYKDKGSMATVGKNKAVAEIFGWKMGGFIAWLIWMFIHLMSLVGFRNRVIVLFDWIVHYFNLDRGIRLIIRPFDIHEARRKRKREMDKERKEQQQQ
ncbi:MAG TPA: NAD(P)/FAD-dependent oxidoreductase [Flavobacteriales bacterium]|nr:NAD(P)/FAD-dependent oxidoreductase [Flavobacteriales bacterium]